MVLFADISSTNNKTDTLACDLSHQQEYLILQIILRGALVKFYKPNVILRLFDELHKAHIHIKNH